MSLAYSDLSCAECWHFLWVSRSDITPSPAPEIVQEAMGGSVDALHRFFTEEDWCQPWSLPLTLWWATAAEWRVVAGWWLAGNPRAARGRVAVVG